MEDRLWIANLARGIAEDVETVRSALYKGESKVRKPIPDIFDALDRGVGETVDVQRSTLIRIANSVVSLSDKISEALRCLDTIEDKSKTIANN